MRIPASAMAALAFISLAFLSAAFAGDGGGLAYGVNEQVRSVRPEKPVRIKLKRSATGKYSWELSGDDADMIMQADEKLRKYIGTKGK